MQISAQQLAELLARHRARAGRHHPGTGERDGRRAQRPHRPRAAERRAPARSPAADADRPAGARAALHAGPRRARTPPAIVRDLERLLRARAAAAGAGENLDFSAAAALEVLRLRRETTACASRACEARPSFTSGPVKPSISSASEASNAGPAMRSQLLSEYLVQRIAVCAPAASLRATSSAFACSSASSQASETRPMRSASSPLIVSQVSR